MHICGLLEVILQGSGSAPPVPPCTKGGGRGTLDQLYTLRRVLEGLWEFAQPVHMCFVDLEKAFDRVPRGVLWGVLHEYGVRGPLLRAVRSLYDRSRSLVRIAGRFLGVAKPGPEGVRFREPQDFISAFCRMMLSCWLHQARTFSVCWSGLQQPSVKRLG
ncbi:hypothetical protein L3Q82_005135 [Scortum barcoo]|uniref:Uncharacterized protein n=1 Tax=Scortum barcoo TaxID=214431 RepID=A0ACB8VEP7_9TELE|nr:hypothetical protein L3Q82_005135 [Scortum barcoo]